MLLIMNAADSILPHRLSESTTRTRDFLPGSIPAACPSCGAPCSNRGAAGEGETRIQRVERFHAHPLIP
jgi:hypothetical protein